MSDDPLVPNGPHLRQPAAYRKAKARADRETASAKERAMLAMLTKEERDRRHEAMRAASRERLLKISESALVDLVASGSFYLIFDQNLRFLRSRRAQARLTKLCMESELDWPWRLRLRLLELSVRHDETLLMMIREQGPDGGGPRQIKVEWPNEARKC